MAKGSDNFGLILVAVVALVAVVGLVILFSNGGSNAAVIGTSPQATVVDTGWVRTNPYAAADCPGGVWTNLVDQSGNNLPHGGRVCSTTGQYTTPGAGETVPQGVPGYQYGAFDVGREWEKGSAVAREYRSPQSYPYLDPYNYVYE